MNLSNVTSSAAVVSQIIKIKQNIKTTKEKEERSAENTVEQQQE